MPPWLLTHRCNPRVLPARASQAEFSLFDPSSWFGSGGADTATPAVWEEVRSEIKAILDDDENLGPFFVRLAWHCAGSYDAVQQHLRCAARPCDARSVTPARARNPRGSFGCPDGRHSRHRVRHDMLPFARAFTAVG